MTYENVKKLMAYTVSQQSLAETNMCFGMDTFVVICPIYMT